MVFTKFLDLTLFQVRRVVLLFLLSSIFTACGSLGTKSENVEEEVVEAVVEEERIITSNPYLDQKPHVDEQTQTRFQNAVESLSNDDLDLAEKQFSEINVQHPELSGPLVNLGIVQYKLGDLEKAEEHWLQAIQVNDLNFDAYNYLGLIYREKGAFTDSESMYKNALAKWDDNAEIHCNLGILYDLYMGQPHSALEEYKLCQLLTEEPSRQLRGWIVDLERRLPSITTSAASANGSSSNSGSSHQ